MAIADFVATYRDLGYGGLLVILVFFVGRHLLKQNKACYDRYEEHVNSSKEEIKALTVQMFLVVEKNTEATTSLQKTMTDIYIRKLRDD